MPLIDRYAPQSLADIVYPTDDAQARIENYITTGANGAHPGSLLLHGPFGTAKTSLIKLVADHLVPVERDVNIGFCCGTGFTTSGQVSKEIGNFGAVMPYRCRYRVMIVDEVDSMSKAAQRELRAQIDRLGTHCLVMFTANELQEVDAGIQSRSTSVLIGRAHSTRWLPRARMIMANEKIEISDENLLATLNAAAGDIRQIFRNLQAVVNAAPRNKS